MTLIIQEGLVITARKIMGAVLVMKMEEEGIASHNSGAISAAN